MFDYGQLIAEARKIGPGEARDRSIRLLLEDDRFPALVSLLLEFQEDLTASVATYDRTPEERAMDAGGLATARQILGALEGISVPVDPEAAAPKGMK